MEYRVEKRDAFEVFGVFGLVSKDMEQAFAEVPAFVNKLVEDGTTDKMNDLLGKPHDSWFHVALFDHTETSFKYMLCQHTPAIGKIPETYTRLKVPALTWVIFPNPTGDIQNLWRRIYSEWFPTSEYEHAEGPSFEMYYGHGNRHYESYGVTEIWIPVKKK